MPRRSSRPPWPQCRLSTLANAAPRFRMRSLRIAPKSPMRPGRSWSCLLENISADELARELLGHCLTTGDWPEELLHRLVSLALSGDSAAATKALFGIVVERLGDLFGPRFCGGYARLFGAVWGRALAELGGFGLVG